MYTSQKSIEAKAGSVEGWKDLLKSVGFRFEPAANNIPAAVFFPQSDPGERLTQCSASLQALLGLSQTSWASLSCLLSSPDSADEIMALFRQAIGQFGPHALEVEAVVMGVGVRLWRIPGCHELLASLGFDLMEVGRDEVTLKTGKTANKRQIQFALQALVALFDTDEAPRCLDIDSSECSDEPEEEKEQEPQVQYEEEYEKPPLPPFPAPRKSSLVLDGSSGAFSSYARNRGEPDGRDKQPDSPPAPQCLVPPPPPPHGGMYHPKGRESDCNFTPSPVDRLSASTRYLGYTLTGNSPSSPRHLNSTLYSPAKAGRARLGPSPLSRPESRSSTQSSQHTAEWEVSGNSTVVRRTGGPAHSKLSPGVTEQGTGMDFRKYLLATSSSLYESPESLTSTGPVVRSVFAEAGYHAKGGKLESSGMGDKLSIRAEVTKSSQSGRRSKDSLSGRLPPTGGTTSPPRRGSSGTPSHGLATDSEVMVRDGATPSIQETIISSQMRRINRELPISEVYHERSLGLGLAPPLSKLIMSNNIAVAQVDHHTDIQPTDNMSNFDNLSVIEEAHPSSSRAKQRPPVPPKPEPWVSAGLIQAELRSPPTSSSSSLARDEGDGRSMTDSQYSGCSPSTGPNSSKELTPRLANMKLKEARGQEDQVRLRKVQGPRARRSREATVISSPAIHPADLSHYINSEFHSKKESKERKEAAPGMGAGGHPGQAQHPHMWDRNGRFTYTGAFSSDC